MLLTLSARTLWRDGRCFRPGLDLPTLPKWAREEFGFQGLTLPTKLFAGWDAPQVERLRDQADKAGCPCLILIEEGPQALASADPAKAEAALGRMDRVLQVAYRLGCSSVVMSIADPPRAPDLDALAQRLKSIVVKSERLELNLLLAPAPGMTDSPEKMTALVRKVGGFRIGAFPDFQAAAGSSDVGAYLRGLTPYASAVCASTLTFDAKGRHTAFDIEACMKAIRSVGFDATLAVEYRGNGDPVPAIKAARTLLESFIGTDEAIASAKEAAGILDEEDEEDES